MTIRAFIFDLDGVITDTAEFHYLSWKRLTEEEKIPFSRDDNEQLRGVTREESLRRLLKGKSISAEQERDYLARKNAYYREYLKELSPEYTLPNVREFLHESKSQGIQLGIGSASRNARDVLIGLGLIDLFEAIGDGSSVVNNKPAPDIFVWVAGRMNVSPRDVVVFEDSESGIDAALMGGFQTIGMGQPHTVREAHWVVNSMADLTVESVLVRFNGDSTQNS